MRDRGAFRAAAAAALLLGGASSAIAAFLLPEGVREPVLILVALTPLLLADLFARHPRDPFGVPPAAYVAESLLGAFVVGAAPGGAYGLWLTMGTAHLEGFLWAFSASALGAVEVALIVGGAWALRELLAEAEERVWAPRELLAEAEEIWFGHEGGESGGY